MTHRLVVDHWYPPHCRSGQKDQTEKAKNDRTRSEGERRYKPNRKGSQTAQMPRILNLSELVSDGWSTRTTTAGHLLWSESKYPHVQNPNWGKTPFGVPKSDGIHLRAWRNDYETS